MLTNQLRSPTLARSCKPLRRSGSDGRNIIQCFFICQIYLIIIVHYVGKCAQKLSAIILREYARTADTSGGIYQNFGCRLKFAEGAGVKYCLRAARLVTGCTMHQVSIGSLFDVIVSDA